MKITIPGKPIPQARMKATGSRGYIKMYDPREKEKANIRKFLRTIDVQEKYSYPHISFIFHMPIPLGVPKKLLLEYRTGFYKHVKKPDVDNLIKLYLDCLDGIVIEGDQKVSLGPCIKLYHPEPATIILLQETGPKLPKLYENPALNVLLYDKQTSFE